MKKQSLSLFVAMLIILGLSVGPVAHAQTPIVGSSTVKTKVELSGDKRPLPLMSKGGEKRPDIRMMIGRGISGKVTAVGANTLTVNGRHASTTGIFTVDVTTAQFFKNKATTTLASIVVGDMVSIKGDVNGNLAIAEAVYAGQLPMGIQKMIEKAKEKKEGKEDKKERKAEHIRGTALFGIVTGVNGTTILVSGKMGTSTATTTYTVDASSAKIFKDKATTTISAILLNDKVLVEGVVVGTNVTAKVIYTGKLPLNGKALGAFAEAEGKGKFLGKIQNFFKAFFSFGKE